ncbi:U4/U6.U5 small nuclear ribonucleoprotein [Neolecta irregularis DAH-3]|uniref:U4/U6.U5 small nuclear ribonucleoprotein n=1 Tax=Neolecta irregularis (strain DAH-3) TaxID=1198029 RepID=A0A1U7LT30_NEOID|nr:U4/U6.U5 small nuclear ribonucleoprotein [Neolecta irregularis DAH-3]|eukprot:OLL25671.1 U4/U6.U5 small nuclear ribonucleoprotein [Neolecta irregularis DAH-3]
MTRQTASVIDQETEMRELAETAREAPGFMTAEMTNHTIDDDEALLATGIWAERDLECDLRILMDDFREKKTGGDRRRENERKTIDKYLEALGDTPDGPERPATRPGEDHLEPAPEIDEEAGLMKLMGFSGFSSTQGKHIPGNTAGVLKKVKPQKFRQYMNRPGGFNKPLESSS